MEYGGKRTRKTGKSKRSFILLLKASHFTAPFYLPFSVFFFFFSIFYSSKHLPPCFFLPFPSLLPSPVSLFYSIYSFLSLFHASQLFYVCVLFSCLSSILFYYLIYFFFLFSSPCSLYSLFHPLNPSLPPSLFPICPSALSALTISLHLLL